MGPKVVSADGRLVYVGVRWAGHDFNLVSAYLQSGDPVGQRKFIQERLDTGRPVRGAGPHQWGLQLCS
eukprot:87390-Chlamydomonas_euryale.AAC.1